MNPKNLIGKRLKVVLRATSWVNIGICLPESDEYFLALKDDRDGKTRYFNIHELETIHIYDEVGS